MELVQGKLSVTNGLIVNANAFPMIKHWNASPLSCVARALFSVADARSSPSCVAVPEYRCQEIAPSTQHALRMYGWLQRCQEIAPSTQHAPCSYAPRRIVERPLPRDSS